MDSAKINIKAVIVQTAATFVSTIPVLCPDVSVELHRPWSRVNWSAAAATAPWRAFFGYYPHLFFMEEAEEGPNHWIELHAPKVLSTDLASLAGLTGMTFAWPSYNVANFVSNDTVLSEPMSSLHVTLLGSLTNIGAFIMTPIFGVIVDKYGRKNSSILSGLPFVIAWSTLSLTTSVPCILAAMAIAGLGTAGQISLSIYISEIAHESIRGFLMSASVIVYFLGLLVSYVLGGCLTYNQIVYTQLCLAVIYILLISCLKESPTFLLQIGKEKEAAQSLAFYRQVSVTSKEVEAEISKIKLQLDPRLEKMLEAGDDPIAAKELIADIMPEEKLSQWQFLKQSHSSVRALIVALICMAVMMLMGNITIQVYAEVLFKEALPTMDSNQCSIYLAIDLLLASIACSLLIDRFGRKFLMISTCVGSSICTLILGTHFQFSWAPCWLTALLIYLYNLIFNMGVAVVPYVLAAELFLPEVRGLCGSIVLSSSWALNFITMVIFTPAVENYGFGPVFYVFTVIGFIGAMLSAIYQPETKGLTVDAIQKLFLKKKEMNRVVVSNDTNFCTRGLGFDSQLR